MSEQQATPNERVRLLLDRAQTALATARKIVDEDPVGAANRAYYAAFDAARAALATTDEAPRTHTGVERRFALHFVRSGRIAPEIGRTLGDAESLRLLADYDEGAAISPGDVHPLIAAVARYVETITETIHPSASPNED